MSVSQPLAIAVATTLMVAACGSSRPDANTRYESVFDIKEAVENGGFECPAWEVRGTNEYAIESADCTTSNVFAIFDSASSIVDQREVRLTLLSIIQDTYYDLTGPNWNVGCSDLEECETLHDLLGGEITEWDLRSLDS